MNRLKQALSANTPQPLPAAGPEAPLPRTTDSFAPSCGIARTDAAPGSIVADSRGNCGRDPPSCRVRAHRLAHRCRPEASDATRAFSLANARARSARTRVAGERRRRSAAAQDNTCPWAGSRHGSHRRIAPWRNPATRVTDPPKHRRKVSRTRGPWCLALGSRSAAAPCWTPVGPAGGRVAARQHKPCRPARPRPAPRACSHARVFLERPCRPWHSASPVQWFGADRCHGSGLLHQRLLAPPRDGRRRRLSSASP